MLDILSNEKHSVKKVVVASSRAIYGEGKYYSKKFGFIYPTARDNIQMAKGQFEPLCCITKVPLSMLSTDEDSLTSSVFALNDRPSTAIILSLRLAFINFSSLIPILAF